jgi:hypothetical protein
MIMKNIYNIVVMVALTFFVIGCGGSSSSVTPMIDTKKISQAEKLDTANVCNVKKNGVAKVLAQAKMFNSTAKKMEIEFMRFHVPTSEYINAVESAIKKGSKTVKLHGKKKKISKMGINKAAWRACTFAIRSLQLYAESQKSWRESVPGDGYKY